ncbi:proline-specific peptidase [Annulohypoxylon maeteangense]|uniref:proline-specific peptidase n=1 Tax=Annulohypoxylon maeteangense TaxID=1927788 RepID=UPI0020077A79|nr:proline-specific peptidase [Annulohypoxylon maeteangense]KAI0886579.1 proline-specific peptidase [Annulohypoxylon maeteangense]
MPPPPTSESELPFDAPGAGKPCKTWYKIVGTLSPSTPPLIALHGGPGSGHDYLEALFDLTESRGIPLILYDQIGCGRSTHLREKAGDESFWTFDLFVKQLDELVDHLSLRDSGFHVLGQSWGGMLGSAYAARRPRGLRRLVLSGAPASMPLYKQACKIRLAELPEDVGRALKECDAKGDHESPEFKDAAAVFMRRFVCRLDPLPEPIQRTFKNIRDDSTAYGTMQGHSEFDTVGSLKDWEGWKDAHNIEAETLLLNGRYDEVMDFVVEPFFKTINKVKWVTLENSSHTSMWEDRERFMQLVGDFLLY